MKVFILRTFLFISVLAAACGTRRSGTSVRSPQNAALIAESLAEIKNKQLYSYIVEWVGTPYRYGGVTKQGVDCSGFAGNMLSYVYKTQLGRSSASMAEKVNKINITDAREGDLLFFSFGSDNRVNHVGVYLNNNFFVHASTSRGVVVDDLTLPAYKNSFLFAGRYN